MHILQKANIWLPFIEYFVTFKAILTMVGEDVQIFSYINLLLHLYFHILMQIEEDIQTHIIPLQTTIPMVANIIINNYYSFEIVRLIHACFKWRTYGWPSSNSLLHSRAVLTMVFIHTNLPLHLYFYILIQIKEDVQTHIIPLNSIS